MELPEPLGEEPDQSSQIREDDGKLLPLLFSVYRLVYLLRHVQKVSSQHLPSTYTQRSRIILPSRIEVISMSLVTGYSTSYSSTAADITNNNAPVGATAVATVSSSSSFYPPEYSSVAGSHHQPPFFASSANWTSWASNGSSDYHHHPGAVDIIHPHHQQQHSPPLSNYSGASPDYYYHQPQYPSSNGGEYHHHHHQPTVISTPTPTTTAPAAVRVVRVVKRRNTANKKERRRTMSINNAFSELRDCIPNVPADTKLSKIKTLRLATSYISYLMAVLEAGPDTDIPFRAELGRQSKSDKIAAAAAASAAATAAPTTAQQQQQHNYDTTNCYHKEQVSTYTNDPLTQNRKLKRIGNS